MAFSGRVGPHKKTEFSDVKIPFLLCFTVFKILATQSEYVFPWYWCCQDMLGGGDFWLFSFRGWNEKWDIKSQTFSFNLILLPTKIHLFSPKNHLFSPKFIYFPLKTIYFPTKIIYFPLIIFYFPQKII